MLNNEYRMLKGRLKSPEELVPICREAKSNSPVRSAGDKWYATQIVPRSTANFGNEVAWDKRNNRKPQRVYNLNIYRFGNLTLNVDKECNG